MTKTEWLQEGERRFGPDIMQWRFVCPVCKHVASVQDWKDSGMAEGTVAFSCVGRAKPNSRKAFGDRGIGPCDYAGGGLLRLNPVVVEDPENDHIHHVFAFAER